MSDQEFTLLDSPQQRHHAAQGGMSRLLSPQSNADTPRANNNNNKPTQTQQARTMTDNPYTSTPAPSSVMTDRTTMPMTAMTQRTTTSSEATVRPVNQHRSLHDRHGLTQSNDDNSWIQNHQTSQSRLSLQLPSILDDGDATTESNPRLDNNDDTNHSDDMVVLSGTDSDQTKLQQYQPLAVPESVRARRLSAAGANISTRRKPGRVSSASAVATSKSNVANDSNQTRAATMTPLRQRDLNHDDMTLPTPELGRHQSPAPSDSFPSLSTPHAYDNDLTTQSKRLPSTYATPAAQQTQVSLDLTPPASLMYASPAAQRRANHVLTTLRSTAKPRLMKGTPHPRRPVGPQLVDTPHPTRNQEDSITNEDTDDNSDAIANVDVEGDVTSTSSSSTDLTNLHRGRRLGAGAVANTSLPTAVEAADSDIRPATAARFNGAKLNAYLHQLNTHLSDENKTLSKELGESRQEVSRLREESLAMSRMERSNGGTSRDEDSVNQATMLQHLQEQLAQAKNEAQDAKRETHDKIEAMTGRIDELLIDLEDKDRELEQARQHIDEQESDFADKMQKLEEELCRVMEEQEQGVEQARKDVENKRKVDEAFWKAEADKFEATKAHVVELQRKLETTIAERDELKQQLVGGLADDSSANSAVISGQSQNHEAQRQVSELKQVVAQLEERLGQVEHDEQRARQLAEEHVENLKQTEEALDESARQLVQTEEEIQSLRQQLTSEKNVVSSLKAQISQLSLTKAKSPLANEAYNASKESVIQSLEEELDQAQQELVKLRNELAQQQPSKQVIDAQDEQIKTLESHKQELEGRVTQLRQQSSIQMSPVRTPERSMLFRSILGVKTPKTPGQFLSNMTAWSPGTGNETITPLLAQIEELELEKEKLLEQLSSANDNVDDKLNKLERAGSGTLSLVRQLTDARAKIESLETELDRLLGRQGLLRRARARLTHLSCPGCSTTFDANKMVQLRVGDDGASNSSLATVESLRQALSAINARIKSLPRDSSEHKVLAQEKADLVKQHALALKQDFELARGEVADLEAEVRDERDRLQALASEQALSSRDQAAIESRLAAAENDLRHVKRDLDNASTPELVERLRAEKDELVSERADLLQKLSAINTRSSRVNSELHSSRSTHSEMRSQIDSQLAEITKLRSDLESRETEKRILSDERVDILRSVAGLQTDLQRVRQDCVSLGLDLANVRRERDQIGQSSRQDVHGEMDRLRDELRTTRRKLNMFEDKVTNHVCSTDSTIMIDLKERHSAQSKGLLTLIKYLKLCVEREASFRNDLSYQKGFLQATIKNKQSALDLVSKQLGLPRFGQDVGTGRSKLHKHRPTLKAVALSIIAMKRMTLSSAKWKQVERTKHRLRNESYPDVRGKPYPV
ncbi:hypothetical protein OIO90_005578 [Microbotryomycetes sp. JL221]|nr:hypothetical protein OIO90_005578 [Microbotryomycetes sp. JL221]